MALEELLEAYQRLVFSICYNLTRDYFEAENLTQDTFLSFWKHYRDADVPNPKPLLCTIAANRCRDYVKSSRMRTTAAADPETLSALPAASPTPEGALLAQEVQERLRQLCGRLKSPYDTIATLYYIEGYTIDEIQQRLGGNRKTLQTQLYRARDRLRDWWKEESS